VRDFFTTEVAVKKNGRSQGIKFRVTLCIKIMF